MSSILSSLQYFCLFLFFFNRHFVVYFFTIVVYFFFLLFKNSSSVSLLVFTLPVESGEKISLGLFVVLSFFEIRRKKSEKLIRK